MPSPNQTEKETKHLFFDLLELDPLVEEDSIVMSVLSNIISKYGTYDIALLSCKDLRSIGANLTFYLFWDVKSIQFHLKHPKKDRALLNQ